MVWWQLFDIIMACYHPKLMIDTGQVNPDTGKAVMKFLGNAHSLYDLDDPARAYTFVVPCNRCLGCRLDYAREWSNRMLLELADNPNALFITLTYDNDHVPVSDKGYFSTSVRDCQLFMKRLRKHFKGRKIRYFIGAEYGPRTNRPHYHGIFFGLTFDDFPDLEFYKNNKLGQPLFKSEFLSKSIWYNGMCVIGSVTKESCGYTARYMLKKLKGKDTALYEEKGIEPEFSLCSRRPGIGLGYYDHHNDYGVKLSVFDGNESIQFPVPKKLFDKLLDIDPDTYYVLKALRRETSCVGSYLEHVHSDLDYLDYLGLKETELYNRIKGIAVSNRLEI